VSGRFERQDAATLALALCPVPDGCTGPGPILKIDPNKLRTGSDGQEGRHPDARPLVARMPGRGHSRSGHGNPATAQAGPARLGGNVIQKAGSRPPLSRTGYNQMPSKLLLQRSTPTAGHDLRLLLAAISRSRLLGTPGFCLFKAGETTGRLGSWCAALTRDHQRRLSGRAPASSSRGTRHWAG